MGIEKASKQKVNLFDNKNATAILTQTVTEHWSFGLITRGLCYQQRFTKPPLRLGQGLETTPTCKLMGAVTHQSPNFNGG